jgi:hypothetical protein
LAARQNGASVTAPAPNAVVSQPYPVTPACIDCSRNAEFQRYALKYRPAQWK